MCPRKIIFEALLLTVFIPILEGCSANNESVKSNEMILPITGTWVNLAYKDVRNKYTNPEGMDLTSPELWKEKVQEWSKIGMEYLVLMEVANEAEAYYPSSYMQPLYDTSRVSPVEAILDEAGIHGMKVFLSSGWARNQMESIATDSIRMGQKRIMSELANLFSGKKSFYGWYLPVEDCICPIFPIEAIQHTNELAEHAKLITPDKKILISPFGIGLADFSREDFYDNISKLKVDIIAYQDEIGCVREKYPLPRLRQNWKKMRQVHDRCGIQLWANCETFTWEKETNSQQSALIPVSYSRLLSQQIAATEGGVERIISFMFDGLIEDPSSNFHLGQPVWANKLYEDYFAWRKGDPYWKTLETSIRGKLKSESFTVLCDTLDRLSDNILGEEEPDDPAWCRLSPGRSDIVLDLGGESEVETVFVRSLNCSPDSISSPIKMLLYSSSDGEAYSLSGIRDVRSWPDQYDTWINGFLFNLPKTEANYLKLSFDGEHFVLIDEIFINPQMLPE